MTERKCLVFNFADIEVREREFLLIKGGERLPVEPTAFRVLLFLLHNPGRLVGKEEIVASVWNDIAVSDNSLTRAIAQLRRVLDDDPREPRYILTVPTLGYRFLSEVKARVDGLGAGVAAGVPSPEVGYEFEQSRGTDRAGPLTTDRPVTGQEVVFQRGRRAEARGPEPSKAAGLEDPLRSRRRGPAAFRRRLHLPEDQGRELRVNSEPASSGSRTTTHRESVRCSRESGGDLDRWQVSRIRGPDRTLSAPDFQR